LRAGDIGSFGGRRNLRVVWVGVSGDTDALTALAARVEGVLQPLGFPGEARPFAAHLTLARMRDDASPAERERVHALLARVEPAEAPSFRVASCSLMRSTLQRGGAVYDALKTYDLEGTAT
jgi:2'-5' RNA ligase